MKSDNRTFIGSILIQRLASLPTWTPTDKARIVYSIETSKLYYGNNIEWVEIPSVPSFMDPITWNRTYVAAKPTSSYVTSGSLNGLNLISCCVNGRVYTTTNGGSSWTQRYPIGNTHGFWVSSISNNDGSIFLAYDQFHIYISRNSGVSWSELIVSGFSGNWSKGDISNDGNTILMSASRLWLTLDGGSSWTEQRPWGANSNYTWNVTLVSSDGSRIIAGAQSQYIYYSSNNGTDWVKSNINGGLTGVWRQGSCSSTGQVVLIGDNSGVWISTDYGATFGSRLYPYGSSRTVNSVAVSGDGSLMVVGQGYIYTSTDGGSSWTQRDPIGDSTLYQWQNIYCSETGQTIIVSNSFALYISTNYGSDWNQLVMPDNIDAGGDEISVASMSGVIYIYSVLLSRLYKSIDGGVSFTDISPYTPMYNVGDVKCDSDGSHIVVAAYDTNFKTYGSSNGGSSWIDITPEKPITYKYWKCAAVNNDGSLIYIGAYYNIAGEVPGRLYKSSNFGTSWDEIRPAGDVNLPWYFVECNSSGTVVVATTNTKVYISQDSGGTWNDRTPPQILASTMISIAINDTGDRIVVTGRSGNIYTSSNYGVDWTEINVVVTSSTSWSDVSCNSDGSIVVVNMNGGRCWISFNYGSTWTETRPSLLDMNRNWRNIDCNGSATRIVAVEDPGGVFVGTFGY